MFQSGTGTAEFILQRFGNRLKTAKLNQNGKNATSHTVVETTRKRICKKLCVLRDARIIKKNVLTLKMAGVDNETTLGCLNKLIAHADFDLPVSVVHHGLVPRQAALVTQICCKFCCPRRTKLCQSPCQL